MSITKPSSSRDHHVVRATREAPPDDSISVRIRKLNHSFGHGELAKQVLFDNDLELTRGETVIMTRPSGSGKPRSSR